MNNGRAVINIKIDVEIDNGKFDDVITEIITMIHGGKLQGDGIINEALFNYDIEKSYLDDFRVEEIDGKTNIIFESKLNKR